MVKTLEVVFAKKNTVLGLTAARHALAEVDPEIVAAPFVPCDSPTGCHFRLSQSVESNQFAGSVVDDG